MRYSYSKVRCFRKCPRAFKFEYIDRIEIEGFETIEAFMGSKVHGALDFFYGEIIKGDVPSLRELLDRYRDGWDGEIRPEVVVNRNRLTREDYKTAGKKKCLEDYYNAYSPFDQTETLSSEMKVDIDLFGDGKYRFIGFIDRLDKNKGSYEIHDYKTSTRMPSQEDRDKDEQLALYELGIRQKFGHEGDVDLVWHYLCHNREIRSRRIDNDLRDLKRGLYFTVMKIEHARKEDFFPAIKTRLCSWCAYNDLCLHEGNIKRTRQATLNAFSQEF